MEKTEPKLRGEEILEEILSRLPVKSLVRFRCISKSWDCLIGSERFIKAHLQNARENKVTFNYIQREEKQDYRQREVKQYSLHSLMNESEPIGHLHRFEKLDKNLEDICILGSCNGLVCIMCRKKEIFHLWNPSTRSSVELPKIKYLMGRFNKYGFGWSGAYKVVVFMHNRPVYKVYSSKTNEWKSVLQCELYPQYFKEYEEGAFVNGKLHWHRLREGSANLVEIVTLDLGSEVVEIMEHPCDPSKNPNSPHRLMDGNFWMSLGVFGGLLSVVSVEDNGLDVWVRKESWSKLRSFHLPFPFCYLKPYGTRFGLRAVPLGIGPNGEFLIGYGSIFLAYHPTKKSVMAYHPKREEVLHLEKFNEPLSMGDISSLHEILHRLDDGGVHFLCLETLVSPKRQRKS